MTADGKRTRTTTLLKGSVDKSQDVETFVRFVFAEDVKKWYEGYSS